MAETAQAQQAVDFLPYSVIDLSNWGVQNYVAGSKLTFQSVAGEVGLAEALIVTFRLNVTPTIAAGNSMAFSPMRSFATRMVLSQGGEVYKDCHPFFYTLKLLTSKRRFVNNLTTGAWGSDIATPQYPVGRLGTTLPALANGAATGKFVYKFIIPLRWLKGSKVGMFPIGDSSNPLQLDIYLPATLAGVDPMNNPFLIVPGSTDSVALTAAGPNTVQVMAVYRKALSYKPGLVIATPVIGSQVKVVQSTVGVSQVGSEVSVPHTTLFPHPSMYTVVNDGDANPNTAGNSLGMLTWDKVSRFRIALTSQTPIIDLQDSTKIEDYFQQLRMALGLDLPDGVWPFVPIFMIEDGFYVDPDLQHLHQFPNFNTWRNALTGLTVAAGTTINSSSAGLARIITMSEYLVGVNY